MQELKKARRALFSADKSELAKTYNKGQLLLSYGGRREQGMLTSIKPLTDGRKKPLNRMVVRKQQIQQFTEQLKEQLREDFFMRCRELEIHPPMMILTAEEKVLDRLIPVPVKGKMGTSSYFGDYYQKILGREKLDSFGLKQNFSYGIVGYTEAHNFINGEKSILEIYQATQAELWSEGYHSSHDITLKEVADYMRMLEAAQVITIISKK